MKINPTIYYFKPHLVDENLEWNAAEHLGSAFTLKANSVFTPTEHELVFVKSGYVRFYFNTYLQKNVFSFIIGRNSLANASNIVSDMKRVAHLSSEVETELFLFDSSSLWQEDNIRKNPELYFGIAKNIAKTTSTIINRAHKTCFYDSITRICRVILDITDREYHSEKQYIQNITQIDIAHLAGIHPVTASRAIKKLREDSIIGEIATHAIEIIDYQRLIDLCKN